MLKCAFCRKVYADLVVTDLDIPVLKHVAEAHVAIWEQDKVDSWTEAYDDHKSVGGTGDGGGRRGPMRRPAGRRPEKDLPQNAGRPKSAVAGRR